MLQCGLATGTVLIILLFPNILFHTAILGALGASAFIVFTMPETRSARPRFLIGGYVVGIAVGCFCHMLSRSPWLLPLFLYPERARIVLGALSVGLAIFFMVITDTEHPPAAGVALGLVLNPWAPPRFGADPKRRYRHVYPKTSSAARVEEPVVSRLMECPCAI